MPSALSAAIAARLDSRMRSRMGAARVAIGLGGRCGLFQDSFHPLDALLDLVDRVRVGQPQVSLALLAEGAPGKQCHAALIQHSVGELSLVLAGLDDVREHIEGAQWFVAAHAWKGVHPFYDDFAPTLELANHCLLRRTRQ